MIKIPTLTEIKNYYPTYLLNHQNPKNRLMHLIGQTVTIWSVVLTVLNGWWFFIPLLPFVVYPFAWFGHFYFEKNKPATFNTNPLLTKACDWVMFYHIVYIGDLDVW